MKHWATLSLLGALLGACASAPPPAPPAELFADALFKAPSEAVDGTAIFALNEAMRAYLRKDIGVQLRHKNPRRALFDALYSKGELKLDYDATMTRNAVQTFEARAGNCLSLVIMTAALAKEMGLAVHYQSVLAEDSWSRSGELYFASGHVNLVLGKRRAETPAAYDNAIDLTIDFQPPEPGREDRSVPIDEATVVAMYMNNRAAETLSQRRVDDAYWWAAAAVRQRPGYAPAYNTLGVVFRQRGAPEQARRAFARALELAPADTRVMDNLALALAALGRDGEARALQRRSAQLQPHPPFEYFERGQAAMRGGDFKGAAALFAREIARDPYYHEFHFWLAQAYYRQGELSLAERELGLARDDSDSPHARQLYAAKLDHLKALRTP